MQCVPLVSLERLSCTLRPSPRSPLQQDLFDIVLVEEVCVCLSVCYSAKGLVPTAVLELLKILSGKIKGNV